MTSKEATELESLRAVAQTVCNMAQPLKEAIHKGDITAKGEALHNINLLWADALAALGGHHDQQS